MQVNVLTIERSNDFQALVNNLTLMEDNKKKVVKTIRSKKAVADKKSEKIYTVTVQFLEVSEEEARIKRGIIDSILKSGYQQKMFNSSSED